VTVRTVLDKSLSDMLVAGELDAILAAQPPRPYLDGHPNIARMFEEFLDVEYRYVEKTKIIPIMHTIAMRKEIVDRHPWTAVNLFNAFEKAKNRSVERALYGGMTYFPILWGFEHARRSQALFDGDYWPYGVESNRRTLEAFLRYAHEQGVCHRLLRVEELFPPQLLRSYRV
jgi:4,5-dihydroxyphthalate decarboxylase